MNLFSHDFIFGVCLGGFFIGWLCFHIGVEIGHAEGFADGWDENAGQAKTAKKTESYL